MAEQLKQMYNPGFFENILPTLQSTLPGFDQRRFLHGIFDERWPDLELKARVSRVAEVLHLFMPSTFPAAADLVVALANRFRAAGEREQGFAFMFLPEYISRYGKTHFPESMAALREVTRLVSAEFAVRPFLAMNPPEAMEFMLQWSGDDDASVRRLSSEGCRPRLPWGQGVQWLKQNPEKIVKVLENLRDDPSEYVRRSVANNLNDISKDHPELVLNLCDRWAGGGEQRERLLRHACRSLLRKGDRRTLSLFGIKSTAKGSLSRLSLGNAVIAKGEVLHFSFNFSNTGRKAATFRIDYAIDYITSTGKTSRKVFRITEREIKGGETCKISGRRAFGDLTTRKHFSGTHRLSIIANGNEIGSKSFQVNAGQKKEKIVG